MICRPAELTGGKYSCHSYIIRFITSLHGSAMQRFQNSKIHIKAIDPKHVNVYIQLTDSSSMV